MADLALPRSCVAKLIVRPGHYQPYSSAPDLTLLAATTGRSDCFNTEKQEEEYLEITIFCG